MCASLRRSAVRVVGSEFGYVTGGGRKERWGICIGVYCMFLSIYELEGRGCQRKEGSRRNVPFILSIVFPYDG